MACSVSNVDAIRIRRSRPRVRKLSMISNFNWTTTFTIALRTGRGIFWTHGTAAETRQGCYLQTPPSPKKVPCWGARRCNCVTSGLSGTEIHSRAYHGHGPRSLAWVNVARIVGMDPSPTRLEMHASRVLPGNTWQPPPQVYI